MFRDRFEAICRGQVKVPGMTVMRDVSTLSTGVTDETVINKIQDWQDDPVLSEYMLLPQSLGQIYNSVQALSNLNEYRKNGFFIVRNLVPGGQLQKYRDRFEAICRGHVKVPGMTVMRDVSTLSTGVTDETVINKIQDWQDDPVLSEYMLLPQILAHVRSIIGKDVMAIHTMLINKPPDTGTKTSRHPLHQDLQLIPMRPADRIVCAWTAMEHVHRANGCLVVVPGSHQGPLLAHEYPDWKGGVNKLYYGIKDCDVSLRTHVEMNAGDTIFFHPQLIHGSGSNQTKGYRKAISCHYASTDCDYIDVRGTQMQSIGDEAIEIAKKRFGHDIELGYDDIWRARARMVPNLQQSHL